MRASEGAGTPGSLPKRRRVFSNTLYSCPEEKELFLKIKQNIVKASQSDDVEQVIGLSASKMLK